MKFNAAKAQFVANAQLLGSQPEKYNLYNGLANIAEGLKVLDDIQRQLKNIQYDVEDIKKKIQRSTLL
ncbi:MAG: hypothetical protein WD883_01995 [Candidatus Colwellbacteria bacterium]